MPKTIQNSSRQTIISFFIITLLIFIAAAVGLKQQFYEKTALPQDTILSDNLFGSNFSTLGDVEIYNSDNLYEKIDGKADLYLNNGFVSLQCRRFTDSSAKDRWAEVYLYDMATGENAFAVYSLQKRSESVPFDWVQFGYSVSDSVYAAFGKYYVEILLSADDKSLLRIAQDAVKQLSAVVSAAKTELPIFNFFPAENLIKDSFKFIKADAFGASCLENIFAAEYKINETILTAYISKTNPSKMFADYYRFLIDNGAKDLRHNIKLSDSKAVELFGTNEIFFVIGDYFAGVRGSAPIENLQEPAQKLIENLSRQK